MILLLRGNDELARKRRIQALKDEADGGSGMLLTNLVEIDGRDAKAEDITGPAMTPPFLAPLRLVIVERFLDRWEGREQRVDESGEPIQPRGLGQFEPLFAVLNAGIPPTTALVLTGAGSGANAMVTRLKKDTPGVTEEVHDEPRKDDLIRFIRDEAAARGVRFRGSRAVDEHWDSDEWMRRPQSDPVALLAGISNGNTLAIVNELDKLALYSMGRDVTVDDVYTLCSGDREVTTFNLLDSIQDGKPGDALHYLARLREKDDVDQYVLTMLTTRFRQTAVMAELLEAGAPDTEVARAMGNAGKYEGLREMGKRRARAIGSSGARAALQAIVETDYRLKKNEIRAEVAVEVLVLKLARMASR
jgi:DNA polymerase III delta subunit